MKNNIQQIEKVLKSGVRTIALLAPSFVSEFDYPGIVFALKKLGFEKVVELTFGAKMVNSEYHKLLKSGKLYISTVCPGITEFIKNEYPKYAKNLISVDSPMIATAKVCKKEFPKYKTIFISPCHFKKKEAESSKYVDYTIDYQQLKELFRKNKIKVKNSKKGKYEIFDAFYNDYTKIYPLAGGLSKTANLKGVIQNNETLIIDGVSKVKEYLDKGIPKNIKFLDVNFCVGGCLGGPCLNKSISLAKRKIRLLQYANYAKKASIKKQNLGCINCADGISFRK
jgi:iron only hydrogenase large subunit-like protein